MGMGFHIESALDRIREGQLHQSALLVDMSRKLNRLERSLTQKSEKVSTPKPSTPFWQGLVSSGVQTAVQWMVLPLTVAYLVRGGDALTLLQTLLSALKPS